MPEEFDPYQQWLGIAKHEQPPNYYRLLGVAELMNDLDAIGNAADRQMNFVRTFQLGKHAETSQKILGELAEAKLCLLRPESKAAYDEQLRQSKRPPAAASPAPPKPTPPPEMPVQPLPPQQTSEGHPLIQEFGTTASTTTPRKLQPHASQGIPQWVWIGLAVVMTLLVGVWIVMQVSGSRSPAVSKTPRKDKKPASVPDSPASPSVAQNLDGSVNLLAALAIPKGEHPHRVSEDGETFITGLKTTGDRIEWPFLLEKGKRGVFRVVVDYACPQAAEGGEFTISVNGKPVKGTHQVRPTGGALAFGRFEIGYIKVSKLDGNVLKLSVKSPIASGTTIMNVRAVRLKLLQKGKG